MPSSKFKLAIVSDAIYPYNKGGKEKRIFEVSTRLSNYDVHIYTMKWWKGKNVRKENGVTLHAISPLYPLYDGSRRSIKEAVFFSFFCFKLLNEKFDIIEADHMPHLVLFPLKIIALLKRKKLYVTWNEVWGRKYWKEYLGFLGNIAYFTEVLSSKMPSVVISVSDHTSKKLAKNLKVDKPIYTINNGINISQIKRIKPSSEKSDIIFAGRLLSHKNVDKLINAVKILKRQNSKIKCLIIGNGPERENLENLVNKLDLSKNVIFYDFLEKDSQLYSLIKSSKVFVLPSTREGFGIVAIEAAACGVPVVTINHPENAARYLAKKLSGIVCRLDEIDLARSIKTLINQKKKQNKYIDAVSVYDWKNIAKQVQSVYQV